MKMARRDHSTAGVQRQEARAYNALDLDYIYLLNGFRIESVPAGEQVMVFDEESLHRAISDYIILGRSVLSPQELRFLRRQMSMTQEKLAHVLGVTPQTLGRHEKGKTQIPGPIERLVRMIYVFETVSFRDQHAWLERIYQSLEHAIEEQGPAVFQLTPRGWVQSGW